MRFIQREGSSADVTFTGDQARILDRNGNVVVNWTTGGVIHDVPQGDGYSLQIKTGSTTTSEDLAVGAVIFTMGQSNIERWFNEPTAIATSAPSTYQMLPDGTVEPVEGGASKYFVSVYAQQLGVPVLIVDGATGGTALLKEADKGNGYWLDTSAGSLYSRALATLEKVGGSVEFVLWAQGETDATADISTSKYAPALTILMARIQSDFSPLKILVQELGPHAENGINDDKYDAVRLAQHQVVDALANVDFGALAADLVTIEDGVHLTGASRILIADRMVNSALKLMGIDITRQVSTGSNLTTGDSRDELRGTSGADSLNSGGGSDVVLAGGGNDTVQSGAGVDFVFGGDGIDNIDGGSEDDVLSGGNGNDVVKGGAGADEIWGDHGDDSITGGAGDDALFGGGGIDTAVYSRPLGSYRVIVSSSQVTVRAIVGDEGTDILSGIENIQFSDQLYDPFGGNLPPLFSPAADFVDFESVVGGTFAFESLYFGLDGNDEVYLPKTIDAAEIAGYDKTAIFDAGPGDDVVIGGGLDDHIRGGDGNDLINGGGGSDRMEGGLGNDTYVVDVTSIAGSGDLVVEALDAGIDTVISTATFTLKSNLENLTLVGTADINGTGNILANVINGNDARNSLNGDAGNDQMLGNGGDDTLRGGFGDDTLDGGAGSDTAVFTGPLSSYSITITAGFATVVDLNLADGNDGTDRISNIEFLRFSDITYTITVAGSLFTENTETVDFNAVTAGSYVAGTQYFAYGGDDKVTLPSTATAATAAGYDPAQAFDGGRGNDWIIGGTLNDWIKGGADNDILDGGPGEDRMEGGTGDDTYYVDVTAAGLTGDLVVEKVGEGIDSVISSATHTLKSNVENLTLTGTADVSGFGNDLDNVIIGNAGKNSIKGDLGNDTLSAGDGDDSLTGGGGDDSIDGGFGNDIALFSGFIADYRITVVGIGRAQVVDLNPLDGDDGTDEVFGVETLKFSNGTFAVPMGSPPTDIALSNARVMEGSLGGTVVGRLSAADPDPGETFTFWVVGSAVGLFAVDGSDLVVAPGARLDFETTPALEVTVRGADAVGHTIDRLFTVTVVDDVPTGAVTLGYTPGTLTLTASNSIIDVDGIATPVRYRWQSFNGTSWSNISGATAATFTPTSAQVGQQLRVVASYTDGVGKAEEVASRETAFVGNGSANTFNGTPGPNVMLGGGGADVLNGGAGDDLLDGGSNTDVLNGGLGADRMIGGASDDTYVVDDLGDVVVEASGGGTDTVQTTLNSYTLAATLEHVTFIGTGDFVGTGNTLANIILGGAGNDILDSGAGSDTLNGGAGADRMTGGIGNDTYVVDNAGDVVVEAASSGTDTVQTSLNSYTLDVTLEHLTFIGMGDFVGTGNDVANTIRGGAGNDTLSGAAGSDTLNGGAGADRMIGGAGNDTYVVDNAGDVPVESAAGGTDTVETTLSNLTLYAEIENLTFTGTGDFTANGNDLANTISGGDGNDRLSGGALNDTVNGNKGNDIFLATLGDGNDTYNGGAGVDAYSVAGTAAAATINLQAGTATSAETGSDRLSAVEDAIGGAGADTFVASTVRNVLDGGDGADTFRFDTVGAAGIGATRDVIAAFVHGSDLFDLRGIDADTTISNNQAFTSVATGTTFTDEGQIRYSFELVNGVEHTIVRGNVGGTLAADFEIAVAGRHDLTAADFFL